MGKSLFVRVAGAPCFLPGFIGSLCELRKGKRVRSSGQDGGGPLPDSNLSDEPAQFPPAGPAPRLCHTPRLMIHLLDGSKPGGFAPEPLSIVHGRAGPDTPRHPGARRRRWGSSASPSASSCSALLAAGVGFYSP